MPAGSSVIRFPYKILLREKERVEHGNKICVNENPLLLRLSLVFYRLGQMESDAGNAFESKDKRYLKGEWKERKGDRRRTSKLTAMLAISIRERRRRRWS
jgi:hypothetical protein